MKELGAFKKPTTLTVDWHNIMYHGNPKAEEV
jgi:hypothetical protein